MLSTSIALLLAATVAAPPPDGRLCIADVCSETAGTTIAVKPEHRERRFFWLSSDAKTAYAGFIAPKAESVVLDPEKFSVFATTIDALDVSMTLGSSPDQQWKWKLDREEAKRLHRLYVPRGSYRLTAVAEHHRTFRVSVSAGAEPSKLDVRLVPLRLARGVVVDVEDRPIARASVAYPDGTACATANEQGAFTCELPERFVEVLVVSANGYAPREVPMTLELDYGRIPLSAGRLPTVKVIRTETSPARVSLFSDAPRYKRSKLKTVSIKEREETVRFDVADGRYFVAVEGDGPLEHLESPLTVKDADTEHEIRIVPFPLVGSVRFGEDPLAGGTIEIIARTWRARLPISGGAFSGTMWQDGVVRAFVSAPELSASEFFDSPQLGDDPSLWDIKIKKRLIAGRVFDAATRVPMKDDHIQVEVEAANSESGFSVPIENDGSYRILAHETGTYRLSLVTPGYMPYSAELRMTAEDRSRTHDIALESGVVQPIEVMTPGGAGVPNVSVFERVRPDGSGPEFIMRTDERGHGSLRGVAGQSRLLYFASPDDSFAIARVLTPRTSAEVKPLQVVIPPPSCALRVRSVDSRGNPVPAELVVRYNGEFIRGAVLPFVARGRATGPSGEILLRRLPPGIYELWALARREDEDPLIAAIGTLHHPVRVGLSGGEDVVTVVVPRDAASRGRE